MTKDDHKPDDSGDVDESSVVGLLLNELDFFVAQWRSRDTAIRKHFCQTVDLVAKALCGEATGTAIFLFM